MTEQHEQNRRELKAEYKEQRPEAGVYRILNPRTGRGLLGSTSNLKSARNRLDFARSTGSTGALDMRLKQAITAADVAALEFEVLEVLAPDPAATARQINDDLGTLEALWREKLGPAALY